MDSVLFFGVFDVTTFQRGIVNETRNRRQG